MVKLMNSILVRTYRLIGNYSNAQQYGLRLPVSVSLLYFKSAAVSVPCSPAMAGYLRDVSKTGLSLVVPSLRFGNRFLVSQYHPLGVTVELPDGVVDIQVAPVRYDKLNAAQGEHGYLIGGRIMRITEADRQRLARHIQQMKKGKALPLSLAPEAKSI
jgi:hypothetical protein